MICLITYPPEGRPQDLFNLDNVRVIVDLEFCPTSHAVDLLQTALTRLIYHQLHVYRRSTTHSKLLTHVINYHI